MPDKPHEDAGQEPTAFTLNGLWPKFDALRQLRTKTAEELMLDAVGGRESRHNALVYSKMLDPIDTELVRLATLAADYKAQSHGDIKHKARMLDELIALEKVDAVSHLARSLVDDIAETL